MRSESEARVLSHRFPVSVKGVVIRDGSVALLRNERQEWELPGGKLDPAESPEECLSREIAEELQLGAEVVAILDCWVYTIAPEARVLIVTYACTEVERRDAVVSVEHSEARWFPVGEVPSLVMPEGYKASILRWADQVARV